MCIFLFIVVFKTITPTFYQNDLALKNAADVTGGKPFAVWCGLSQVEVQLILKLPFTTMKENERCCSFVLSRTQHGTYKNYIFFFFLPLAQFTWGRRSMSSYIDLWNLKIKQWYLNNRTVNSTSDYTLWILYRSYFKGISANIELQVYSVTCCWPYVRT
jgi:hypothetical protein